MKTKLAKWGNSLGLRLPKVTAEEVGLKEGDVVDVLVEGSELRLRRQGRTRLYSLEEMLAEMDRLGPENRPKFIDFGPDVGAEIIDDNYSRGNISAPGRGPGLGRSGTHTGKGTRRRQAGSGSDRS
ncbi:MAG: AbrB/MazE/SpoVT family DNA-binding domain-containing protein [Methyloceanibacter sp.]